MRRKLFQAHFIFILAIGWQIPLRAESKENIPGLIVSSTIGHSLLSFASSGIIHYANGANAPYGYTYLGSWTGGLIGLGGGLLIAWILPSRDPTGLGKVFLVIVGYGVGSFLGANIAYRASEYPSAMDPNSAKANVTLFSMQYGF